MASALRDASWMQGVWTERDVSPSGVEAALRRLLCEQHARGEVYVPARVLNLVVIVDSEWRGEIYNRLERIGRRHPSRTILCAVEPGRESIDAWAMMTVDDEPRPGQPGLCRERVVLDLGPRHVEHLHTIVDPLVVIDLATVVWSPHGHPEAVEALLRLAQVVLTDSMDEPSPADAIRRARELGDSAHVVDLAWLRSAPWRERITATFDPPAWRLALDRISGVTVRHHPGSAVAGLLLLGWLAARLDWEPRALVARNGSLHGRAGGPRHDATLRLEPDPRQAAPGLAGVTVETSSGMSISLDRGPSGLVARRVQDGRESTWTVLGASRGEDGVLGEGIRQALLRDVNYRPALEAAVAMVS